MRVGTFDSRAVALAYYRKFYRSPKFVAHLKKLREDRDQANAAGDHEKAKKLEAEGRAEQGHSHSQVFRSAPIDEIVAKIKDQLPNRQAGRGRSDRFQMERHVPLARRRIRRRYGTDGKTLPARRADMENASRPNETSTAVAQELQKHENE